MERQDARRLHHRAAVPDAGHVDEPRAETKRQEELFDPRGRQLRGWTNKLIWGDNKLILSSLKSGALRRQIEDAGGLRLIYIDPPFDVGADFSMDIEIGGETFHKEPNLLEQIAYRDTWGRGADSFIAMIYERLILMRDLMHPEGSIYVHCDWRVNSHIRLALDEVFGRNNHLNQVVWKRIFSHSGGNKFGIVDDTLLAYTRGERFTFNKLTKPHDESYIKSHYGSRDAEGKQYRLVTLSAKGPGPARKFGDREIAPPPGRHWAWSQERIDEGLKSGKIVFASTGQPNIKQYLDDTEGTMIQTIWDDLPPVNPISSELLGYPTQKPEGLLERILQASSNEGDLVADFFCGSGTTAAVAEKLGRKWIATDLGKFGIHTTRKRLIQVQRELKAAGRSFRAFEVLNLGRYERQAYLNISPRLSAKKKAEALAKKEQEFRDLILKAYRAEPLPDAAFFHGKSGGRLVVVGPINLPVGRLFIEEVITECRKRGASRVDVLAFEFEMGLFPAVLEEAKQKGLDLAPKTIPPEVFDRRAVEKGQVRFHDVAYIEVTPRFDKKNKLALAVELTDFSVYYSQGISEAITAELKAGKSEVVCEAGKLVKFSKDKNGVLTRDVLTKKWTDWVDYWAVDFDYESRKEIIKVPRGLGAEIQGNLSGMEEAQREMTLTTEDYEERWTGAYIFENQWQSFRTRQSRDLELKTASHTYDKPARYIIAVKVIDIFGNDTMTLVPVTLG